MEHRQFRLKQSLLSVDLLLLQSRKYVLFLVLIVFSVHMHCLVY